MSRRSVLTLVTFVSIVHPAAAQAPATLTLADAVQRALASNDRVLSARDAMDRAAAGVRIARSAFTPQVVPTLSSAFGQEDLANQRWGLAVGQRFQTGTELSSGITAASARNQFGTYYVGDTTFLVRQPLLRGFGRAAARDGLTRAEVSARRAAGDYTRVQNAVAIDVAGAYYDIIRQRTLATVAGQALERARTLADASDAKLKAGRVSQLDALRARQLVSQAEAQVLDATAAIEDATDRLRLLTGIAPGDPVSVADRIPQEVDSSLLTLDVLAAIDRRVEVEDARVAAADADRVVSVARQQVRPQVDVSLAVTRQSVGDSFRTTFDTGAFRFATFATVAAPLDRTVEQASLESAILERDQRRRELEAIHARLEVEARQGARQYRRAIQALTLGDEGVTLAHQELDVARMRYERGLATNLDLMSAESNVIAAETRRIDALADLALRRLALRAALGVLDPRADIR